MEQAGSGQGLLCAAFSCVCGADWCLEETWLFRHGGVRVREGIAQGSPDPSPLSFPILSPCANLSSQKVPGVFGCGCFSAQVFGGVQGGRCQLCFSVSDCQSWTMDLCSEHFSAVHWGTPSFLGHGLEGIPSLGAQSHSDLQSRGLLLDLWILQPF